MSQISDGVAIERERGGKYLTFFLAGEEYGVEILKVREIIGILPVTRIPRTPESVLGVINLRGKVIPVLDLKRRLGMVGVAEAEKPCVVVVNAAGVELGMVIDRISEVVYVAAESVEDTPSFGMELDTDFLLGIAKSEGRVKLLLDIDRVLSSAEIGALAKLTDEATQSQD